MKTAIFLGAGASAADRAPLQKDIFKKFFENIQDDAISNKIKQELVLFFLTFFNGDPLSGMFPHELYPTFEEAIGILDLAYLRHESFREYDLQNINNDSNRIGKLRQYLILAMAKVIGEEIGTNDNTYHDNLVSKLNECERLNSTIFISSNYDILIDNALIKLGRNIDYGIKFAEASAGTSNGNDFGLPKIKLLKLHGSLNWLFCPTCCMLFQTPKEKAIMRLMENIENAKCTSCSTLMFPIIVPPTYYKDMTNVFLSSIWNEAEVELHDVNHIIFCGYSMPEADMHIKYLMKRAQVNKDPKQSIFFTIYNNYAGKSDSHKKIEEDRYLRYFGPNAYYSRNISFEEFASEPSKLIDPNNFH